MKTASQQHALYIKMECIVKTFDDIIFRIYPTAGIITGQLTVLHRDVLTDARLLFVMKTIKRFEFVPNKNNIGMVRMIGIDGYIRLICDIDETRAAFILDVLSDYVPQIPEVYTGEPELSHAGWFVGWLSYGEYLMGNLSTEVTRGSSSGSVANMWADLIATYLAPDLVDHSMPRLISENSDDLNYEMEEYVGSFSTAQTAQTVQTAQELETIAREGNSPGQEDSDTVVEPFARVATDYAYIEHLQRLVLEVYHSTHDIPHQFASLMELVD